MPIYGRGIDRQIARHNLKNDLIKMEKKLFKEIDDIELNHWWFKGRRKIIGGILKSFVRSKKDSALDIGFGTGSNANLLKEHSLRVFGLDPAYEAIEFSKKRNPGTTVFHGSFPEYNFGRKYDLVTLFDVLEHIKDDAGAVKQLEKLMNKNGVALITVPALTSLWTEHDVLLHHYRRYTKEGLKNLISNNTGLTIEKISYFNSFLFFPIFIFRSLRRVFNLGEGSSDFFTVPAVFNKLFYGIFSLESHLLKFLNLPVGVSLVCVVKKS